MIRDEPVATETGEGHPDRLTGRADVVGELLMRLHDVDERPAAVVRTPELSREVEVEAGELGLDVPEDEIRERLLKGSSAPTRERCEREENVRVIADA